MGTYPHRGLLTSYDPWDDPPSMLGSAAPVVCGYVVIVIVHVPQLLWKPWSDPCFPPKKNCTKLCIYIYIYIYLRGYNIIPFKSISKRIFHQISSHGKSHEIHGSYPASTSSMASLRQAIFWSPVFRVVAMAAPMVRMPYGEKPGVFNGLSPWDWSHLHLPYIYIYTYGLYKGYIGAM